jgi:arylsulfatase A-like enzyme
MFENLLNIFDKVKDKKCLKIECDTDTNTILILMDELINYKYIPKKITNLLPGYKAFKKIGIEFTNISNNRQQCSSSRSTIPTSIINTGIQDDIDLNYQYDYIPQLSKDFDTIGKILKINNISTAYFGKQHLQSQLATDSFTVPACNLNTIGSMKIYGYDQFNIFGDTYYYGQHGILGDVLTLESIVPPLSTQFDYYDKKTKNKYSGVIPYINKKYNEQNKKIFDVNNSCKKANSFYLEFQITNPHDTTHFWSAFNKKPTGYINTFTMPFLEEQVKIFGTSNPYYFNELFPDAYVKNKNLVANYFENTYNEYSTQINSLPFVESYTQDYATNPTFNHINPFFAGANEGLINTVVIPTSSANIAEWKNTVNNYYGLIIEADSYVYKVYKELVKLDLLKNTNVIITADHGDAMSAHGLRQKLLPFNECVNVPLIIYSPHLNNKLRNTKSDIYGSLIDITPTTLVLNKIKNNNDNFLGKSLLKWKNNHLDINIKEHLNYVPLTLVNSTLYANTYFFYKLWTFNNSSSINKLWYTVNNYYEYASSFVMINTKLNNIQYKFGRYYSIVGIITYNLANNIYLSGLDGTFNIDILLIYLTFTQIPETYKKYIKGLYELLFGNTTFTFEQGLSIVGNFIFGNNFNIVSNDSYLTYNFINAIIYKINKKLELEDKKFLYKLPGSVDSYQSNQSNSQIHMFLYDETNDPNEVKNLLDSNNTCPLTLYQLELLNTTLNESIVKYNLTETITIIPNKTLKILELYLFYMGGLLLKNLDSITSLDKFGYDTSDLIGLYFSLNGTSKIDGALSPEYLDKVNDILKNLYVNLSEPPFDFIDCSIISDNINNYVYIGKTEYLEIIFNSNYVDTIFDTTTKNIIQLNPNDIVLYNFIGIDKLFTKSYIYNKI